MHIYAFGSVCRGEVSFDSDIDLLAIVKGVNSNLNPSEYSIYSYDRVKELWQEGNPFAWHLHLEAKLIYSSDSMDFISRLGTPSTYKKVISDCEKFFDIVKIAEDSLRSEGKCDVFDLSTVFLGIRNFATCFSLSQGKYPTFSRHAAFQLGSMSLEIDEKSYDTFEGCRILCTRGLGEEVLKDDIGRALRSIPNVLQWMNSILSLLKKEKYE